eukprot:6214373-Pleurochrysis_carterae.AAC.13
MACGTVAFYVSHSCRALSKWLCAVTWMLGKEGLANCTASYELSGARMAEDCCARMAAEGRADDTAWPTQREPESQEDRDLLKRERLRRRP